MNVQSQNNAIKHLFSSDAVSKRFAELLGNRAPAFITSVLQVVASNDMLKNADPASVYHVAAVAATMNLPLNNNLGYAYIVPYKDKNGNVVAQFQMGYKGFIQLAHRTGQFKTIAAAAIYEGQLISENPLTGFKFDFTKKSEKVIGYAAYFLLHNGFEKTLFMPIETVEAHAKKYSKSFAKYGSGLWKDDFESMANKTVLKLLLSKYAPLSIDIQNAVVNDQATYTAEGEVKYIDNEPTEPIVISENQQLVDSLNTFEELEELKINNPDDAELVSMIFEKQKQLNLKTK